ncbi:MAG: hypothetical protein WCB68_13555 [Pyrinomonadaceae bacterium]
MWKPRCPKCGSAKVRRGYKKTHTLLRLFGIRHLLCQNCHKPFTGFVTPGSLQAQRKRESNFKRQPRKSAASSWLALAERARRKGHLANAITLYQNALDKFQGADGNEAQEEETRRIVREVEMLRAYLNMQDEDKPL